MIDKIKKPFGTNHRHIVIICLWYQHSLMNSSEWVLIKIFRKKTYPNFSVWISFNSSLHPELRTIKPQWFLHQEHTNSYLSVMARKKVIDWTIISLKMHHSTPIHIIRLSFHLPFFYSKQIGSKINIIYCAHSLLRLSESLLTIVYWERTFIVPLAPFRIALIGHQVVSQVC